MAKAILREEDLLPPSNRSVGYEGLRLDHSPISLTTLVSAGAVLYGAAFQIGYFVVIGVEFLPFLGVLDFVFPIAAMVPWMLVWYPLASFLYRRTTRQIDRGIFGASKTAWFVRTYFRFEILVVWLSIIVLAFWGVSLFELIRAVCVIVLFVASTTLLAALREQARWSEHFSVSTIIWFVVQSSMLMVGVGAIYADHLAGRKCTLRTAEAVILKGRYLRPVGDGHLFRQNERIMFLNKSDVKSIVCEPSQKDNKSESAHYMNDY